jgi:hypothetical protein
MVDVIGAERGELLAGSLMKKIQTHSSEVSTLRTQL